MTEKTHYRKAFNSPYLSSADIVEPITLTISHVVLAGDESHKSKDNFNTAHFVEKEIRPGERLKPMILNVGNSEFMKAKTGTPFINEWNNITVSVYVQQGVKFGRDLVEGLRLTDAVPTVSITEEQQANIQALLDETGADKDGFLKFCKSDSIAEIPANKYSGAIAALQAKRKA